MKKLINFSNRMTTLQTGLVHTTLVIILALLVTSCRWMEEAPTTVPEGAQAGDLVGRKPCTYEANKIEYEADCATLIVEENRNDPNSRLIALPVLRVFALNDDPADPIFWFAGGPGSTNMTFSHLEGLIDHHDIVMVGYRGVDGSSVLDCPEAEEAVKGLDNNLLSEKSIENIGNAFTHCFMRLENDGIDLDGYTILEVVEDNEAAREGLGYQRVNLLSGSYGTRVAQIYSWMYPDIIFRSVMISVNPPGHMVWEPDVLDSQIEYDAQLCARDSECSSRTANLSETMQRVVNNMPNRWLIIPIDEGKVRFMTHFLLWHRGTAAAAYDIYLAAEQGDPSGLALLSIMYNMMAPSILNWGDLVTKATSADFDPTRDYLIEMHPPDSILGAPMSELAWCSVQVMNWKIASIPEEFRQVRLSHVETLLISGNIDATTPAQWATEELLPSLSNGVQVVLSEFGHTTDIWSLQPEAIRHLLTTFYETGEVDDSLFIYQPMDFNVGLMSYPLLAKVMVVAIILVPLILAALVWFLVRTIRRRKADQSLP